MNKSIYLYSVNVPLHLAEALAQATREEIARSVQNNVPASVLVDMAGVLADIEERIEEAKKEDNETSAE